MNQPDALSNKSSQALWLVCAVVCFVAAAYFYLQKSSEFEGSVHAKAKVVEVLDKYTSSGKLHYYVFEYDVDNRTSYRFNSELYEYKDTFKVGDTVNVFYPKNNPANAKLDDWKEKWLRALLCLGAAFVCLGAVAKTTFFNRRGGALNNE